MLWSASFLLLAYSVSSVAAAYKGFCTSARFSNGTQKHYDDFVLEFKAMKDLAGTDGSFTSIRLYSCLQADTGKYSEAFKAAIDTQTDLLLGMWTSAPPSPNDTLLYTAFANELGNLTAAVKDLGTEFTKRVVGISVGSEDVYRYLQGDPEHPGTNASTISYFIDWTRAMLANTDLAETPIGHVDVPKAWLNSTSNSNLTNNVDFLGLNQFAIWEGALGDNTVGDAAKGRFEKAMSEMVALGKPVWMTETGWVTRSGEDFHNAVPGIHESRIYWSTVACELFQNKVNTWWYILQDDYPAMAENATSWGVLGPEWPPNAAQPLYDLSY